MRLLSFILLFILFGCQDFYSLVVSSSSSEKTIKSSWAVQLGGVTKAYPGADNSSYDVCYRMALDPSGNVICAGWTNGSPGETSGGSEDAFVMKLDPNGNLLWLKQFGSDTAAISPHILSAANYQTCDSVAVDKLGYIYCGGGATGSFAETGDGSLDAFVIKLSPDGEIVWVKQIGTDTESASLHVVDTAGGERCSSIAVDDNGFIYCGGYTSGSFGETNASIYNDVFVLKLNSDGDIVWLKQIGADTQVSSIHINDTSSFEGCTGITLDSAGGIYCVGSTGGSFGEAHDGSNDSDAFVLKLDVNGDVEWLSHLGVDTAAASIELVTSVGTQRFDGVTIDKDGNIICAGYTQGSFAETTGGGNDPILAKFDPNGQIIWIKQLGADTSASSSVLISTNQYEDCQNVTVDKEGYIYCSGETGSVMAEAVGAWWWDPMVMKFDPNGELIWIRQFGSVTLNNPAYLGGMFEGIAVDQNGNVYASGEIYGYASEAGGGNLDGDAFVVKIKPDGTIDI